ncbi:MAG: RraA family protein [Pseudorhodoferax sp.]
MTGRAWTLLYGPAGNPAGTVGDYIDDVAPGSVIVLDNGGRDNATVWGDILTEVAHARGVAGTVIDGIYRDVALSLQLGYPISAAATGCARARTACRSRPRACRSTSATCACARAISLRGDADGVVVIPKAQEDQVLATAEAIQQAEDAIRASVRDGMGLREARVRHGYHQLQTREAK